LGAMTMVPLRDRRAHVCALRNGSSVLEPERGAKARVREALEKVTPAHTLTLPALGAPPGPRDVKGKVMKTSQSAPTLPPLIATEVEAVQTRLRVELRRISQGCMPTTAHVKHIHNEKRALKAIKAAERAAANAMRVLTEREQISERVRTMGSMLGAKAGHASFRVMADTAEAHKLTAAQQVEIAWSQVQAAYEHALPRQEAAQRYDHALEAAQRLDGRARIAHTEPVHQQLSPVSRTAEPEGRASKSSRPARARQAAVPWDAAAGGEAWRGLVAAKVEAARVAAEEKGRTAAEVEAKARTQASMGIVLPEVVAEAQRAAAEAESAQRALVRVKAWADAETATLEAHASSEAAAQVLAREAARASRLAESQDQAAAEAADGEEAAARRGAERSMRVAKAAEQKQKAGAAAARRAELAAEREAKSRLLAGVIEHRDDEKDDAAAAAARAKKAAEDARLEAARMEGLMNHHTKIMAQKAVRAEERKRLQAEAEAEEGRKIRDSEKRKKAIAQMHKKRAQLETQGQGAQSPEQPQRTEADMLHSHLSRPEHDDETNHELGPW